VVILNTMHTPTGTWRVEARQEGTAYWYSITRNGVLQVDGLTVADALATVERLARAEAAVADAEPSESVPASTAVH
jgi:hypothetical protein